MMLHRKKNQGYAIVIVLVLLVIGTVLIIMFNRESLFFTKVAGIFSRSRKIQSQALDGIELAKGDLRTVTKNSRDTGLSGVDRFTSLASGGQSAAYNQGLYCDYVNHCDPSASSARTITPRISRTDGDYELKVYYFPENPCTTSTPCNSDTEYNGVLPKRFLIISESTNKTSGEVFTAESRIQIKFENYAEISYGIMGAKCVKDCSTPNPKYFPLNTTFRISPATYEGRAYFDLPPAQLKFIMENSSGDASQQHIFKDLVTFKNTTPSGQTRPFITSEWSVYQQQANGDYADSGTDLKPMMRFDKGYEEGKPLAASATDESNPSSDAYFSKMQTAASYNLTNDPATPPCPISPNAFGIKQVDVCLKFVGNQIKRYDCQKYNDDFMGRIDKNIHPASAYGTGSGYTHSTQGVFQAGTGIEDTFPDRYAGEHAEVYHGTAPPLPAGATSSTLGAANGIIFCDRGSDCTCNVHIKGILSGQVNVVAQNVVIEGDLRYQNQSDSSIDSLGVVAKNQIIIPAAVPQAATSASSIDYSQQDNVAMQDKEAPFTHGPGGAPGNLAEAYKDITNFIPYDTATGQYVDRNSNSNEYAEFARWNLSQTNNKVYASPTALDLDGFFYAGDTVKVDGIFNPKEDGVNTYDNSGKTNFGMAFITCENPPTCTSYKYRDPSLQSNSDPKALYKADGTLVDSATPGVPVEPLYYVDGLNRNNMYIGQDYAESTNANFNNVAFQPGEEVARPLNRVINVFGGMNSKFNFIYDNMTSANGQIFRMGFKRKLITKNKNAAYLAPPGYPSTASIKIDELYTKSQQGKSALLSQ